jgi:hypothetical protein
MISPAPEGRWFIARGGCRPGRVPAQERRNEGPTAAETRVRETMVPSITIISHNRTNRHRPNWDVDRYLGAYKTCDNISTVTCAMDVRFGAVPRPRAPDARPSCIAKPVTFLGLTASKPLASLRALDITRPPCSATGASGRELCSARRRSKLGIASPGTAGGMTAPAAFNAKQQVSGTSIRQMKRGFASPFYPRSAFHSPA